jgi:hypothetical protein
MGAVLVVVLGVGGTAHAEVVFRKKPPAATTTDTGATEGSPSGDEAAAAGQATDEAAPKGPLVPQAEDKDFPEAEAIKQQKAADAALARKMRAAEAAKQKDEGTPIYQKWQFWAITGGVVVGSILAIWAGSAIWHQMQGGDIRGCMLDSTTPAGCYGEGR